MIAIFCATPYHLLTAINMKLTVLREKETDLYIVGNFADAKDISVLIQKENIFKDIKYMDVSDFNALDKKNYAYKLWVRFKKYLNYEKELARYVDLIEKKYQAIYYASRNQYSDYVIKHFNDKNNDLKVCVFEDGLGEYFNADSRKPARYKRLIFSILGFPSKIYEYEEIWLYRPEACVSIEDREKLRKLPSIIDSGLEGQSVLSRVFQCNGKIYEKIILFEQDYKIEQQAFSKVLSLVESSRVILKTHPRKDTGLDLGVNVFKEKNIPWEINCLSQNMKEKVLISINSTACFTPKFIFNQEPTIILLYKIFETGYKEDPLIMGYLIKKLKESYAEPTKIIIPQTISELEEQLLIV